MAGKKPTGDLVTRISLNGEQPVQTLKSLRAEVSSTTSAWRAHAAELRTTGDQLGAAKAKYDGLTQTIEKQKNLLNQQKDELQKLKQAQNEVDTSTAKGKQEYEGYASQIAKAENNVAKATTRLASLTTQQEKAKQSLDYYESGLAKAQTELRNISSASNTYVQRLEAEGKQEEANKVKLESLGNQYGKLNEIYRIQASELNKIANEAGKSSDAYRIQKQRVDQTATSLAKTKTQMNELSESMHKANPSVFDRIKAKLTGVNSEAKETHSLFKTILGANILTSVGANAWNSLTGWISNAKEEAKEYSLQQQTMLATWHTLTGSAKEGQKLVDMTTQMAISAQNSVEMVDQLNQKFYAISKNADLTGKLTKSVLTLQDAFGATDDAVENFGVQFAQMMANGKVSAQDMMSFVNVFPVLRTNLLKTERSITHNSKMTMSQMNDLMSAGKITSKTMEQVLQDTAKQYQGATENFGKTIPGMMRTIKSQMPVLLSAISDPLTKAANPIVSKVSDWVTSKDTKNSFTKLGKTFSDGLNRSINAMSSGGGKNAGKGVTDTLNKALEKANDLVKSFFDFLTKHGKSLGSIVVDVTKLSAEVGKQVWKDFADILGTAGEAFGLVSEGASKSKDPMAKVASALHNLAKNKAAIKLIAGYIVTMGAVKSLTPLATSISGVAGAAKKGYKGVRALRAGIKGLDSVSELKGPEKALAKLGSVASTIAKGIKKDIGSALSGQSLGGSLQSLKSAGGFKNLSWQGKTATAAAGVGVALDAGSSIVSAVKDKKGSSKQYQDAGKGIGSAIGGGIGMWFGGPAGAMIGSQIGKVVGGWGGKAVKNFQNGWNSKKPPKNFWSIENLGWSTHDTINKIGKAGKDAVGSLTKGWNSNKPPKKMFSLEGLGFMAKNFSLAGVGAKAVSSLTKGWKSKKPPKNFWSLENLGWSAKDMFGKINKGMSDFWKKSKSGFSKWSKDVGKNSKSFVKNFGPNMKKGFNNFLDNGHNFFKKFNTNMGNFFRDLPKNKYVKAFQKGQLFQVAYKDIQKKTKKWTKDFGKSWNKHWSDSQKTVKKWANNTHKAYTKGTKFLEKTFSTYTKNAKKNWTKHWNNLQKNVGNFWNKAKKTSSKGTKNLLNGVKSFANNSKKQWSKHFDAVRDLQDDFNKNLKKNHGNLFDALKDTAEDQLNNLKKKWSQKWDDIKNNTSKTWDNIKKGSSNFGDNMNKWFSNFSKGFQKAWSNMGDGIHKIFSNAMDSIKKLASNGVNGLIDILNGGIGAVNNVIYFFGGSKSSIKSVGHVKFAKGTGYFGTQRRAITEPTLAMVNDGNDSPETGNKEALYRPATGDFGIFQGRNVSTILQPGDEILNATETKMLMQSMGMSHFAGGTGFFSSIVGKVEKGVSGAFNGVASWAKNTTDGLKKFFDLAEKIIKNPGGYLDSIFKFTGIKNLNSGAMKDIAQGGYNKGKDQVTKFWKELWSMVSGTLDGGGAEGGLLGAVEKYGKGHPYVWGAAGPDAFDCSGLVMYALEKAFHKSFPHYSGAQYSQTVAVSDPQPGDLVFFGPGGSEHVGVYAGGGKYYSAMSPSSSPNIGMSPVSSGPGSVSYRRIPGLKGEGASTGDVKANNGLQAFIKKVIPSGFFKFISKLGSLFGIDSEADPAGMGVQRWGELVKKALQKNGLPDSPAYVNAWLRQIQTESGGNPRAVGGNDGIVSEGNATGLLQTKPGTFNANAFAGHHNIMNGYDNMLAAIHYAKVKYGSSGMLGVIGHGHGYANGGIANKPSIFGEAGPEMAIPLSAAKSSRTYELIGKTAAIAASRDNIEAQAIDSELSTKIDGLVTSINTLVQVLTGETQVTTTINMDGKKVGQQVAKYVSREMGHRMKGRANRLSGY